MGLKEILPETKQFKTKIYDHNWEIEVKILSYKAKQEYIATNVRNKKISDNQIEFSNFTANDLLDSFQILFFNGLNSLYIDEQKEEINKETYNYLINNLSEACEWIRDCIINFNGNFFLVKK